MIVYLKTNNLSLCLNHEHLKSVLFDLVTTCFLGAFYSLLVSIYLFFLVIILLPYLATETCQKYSVTVILPQPQAQVQIISSE
jgi:hypothetical protein